MGRVSESDRRTLELYIFLPMALTILSKDILIIKDAPFKLPVPYIQLVEETEKAIHNDLRKVKHMMKVRNLTVIQEGRDEVFSQYLFIYNGYEEKRNYFNPKIRQNVEALLKQYLLKRDEEFLSVQQL
ncbi:hypothetical protein [Bacillus solimangrovi]|uniref:YhjD n=1 Tax=Bacillus solimangrovi TaxID=1305675 RepID=A0A1E5LED4_9BACI|nr:hypothetical protein [Bacillus solimangrovi]OEH92424.1 hypothetical protein BFG57_16075 [Bacillus solimangrovi]